MSEYQYYEFQAIDRPLTESDLAYLRTLSSRGYLTATSASFEYNYGDFRGNEDEILEEYFDALLYITNWGVRRLVFRFPKALINLETVKLYTLPEVVMLRTTDNYVLIDIYVDKEEGEWVETGEGWLSRMMMLRDAILHGDYRALYLGWLHAMELNPPDSEDAAEDEYDDEDEYEDDEVETIPLKNNTLEPPVPPNLSQLEGPLQAFVEFFEIDPQLVRAAAAASPTAAKASEPIEKWINALPEQECRALLLQSRTGRSEYGAPGDRCSTRALCDIHCRSTRCCAAHYHGTSGKRGSPHPAHFGRKAASSGRSTSAAFGTIGKARTCRMGTGHDADQQEERQWL